MSTLFLLQASIIELVVLVLAMPPPPPPPPATEEEEAFQLIFTSFLGATRTVKKYCLVFYHVTFCFSYLLQLATFSSWSSEEKNTV